MQDELGEPAAALMKPHAAAHWDVSTAHQGAKVASQNPPETLQEAEDYAVNAIEDSVRIWTRRNDAADFSGEIRDAIRRHVRAAVSNANAIAVKREREWFRMFWFGE